MDLIDIFDTSCCCLISDHTLNTTSAGAQPYTGIRFVIRETKENIFAFLTFKVHHKTEFGSNLTGHGFPDPGHLDNVLEELRAQGITEDDGLLEK